MAASTARPRAAMAPEMVLTAAPALEKPPAGQVDIAPEIALIKEPACQVLIALGQKATHATAGILQGLARPRVQGAHHGPHHLAGGEELATIRILFTHLQQVG